MENKVLEEPKKEKKKKLASLESQRKLFYVLMFALPSLQFLVFYIYVNFNSILFAFQKYTPNLEGLGYQVAFAGFDNFKTAWNKIMSADGWDMIVNSLRLYGWNLLFVTPTALFFSYYISKEYKCSGFFRVILYLPTIVSSLIMALLYKYIVTDVYGFLTGDKVGLLGGTDTDRIYYTVLFFNIWIAYGSNVMLYTGAMSNIDASILEACKLDGANTVQEFTHIYLPLIFPTIITFILTGIAGIFTNQMAMFHLFGSNVPGFDVFGYFFYRQTAGNPTLYPSAKKMSLPELSAMGLIITAIIAPVTLIVRKVLERVSPSAD